MTPFEASLMSLDSSGFTCAPAPAPVSQRVPAHASFSEPAAMVAKMIRSFVRPWQSSIRPTIFRMRSMNSCVQAFIAQR